jgi:hypothetical protein
VLTTYPLLAPRSSECKAITLLYLWAFESVTGFTLCYAVRNWKESFIGRPNDELLLATVKVTFVDGNSQWARVYFFPPNNRIKCSLSICQKRVHEETKKVRRIMNAAQKIALTNF